MGQSQAVKRPLTDSDDQYWRTVAGWWEPSLGSEAFGALLGVSPAAVRQYRSRDKKFPEPAATALGARWALAQAYLWIRAARPGLHSIVPRIFHDGHGLSPAKFVAAESALVQVRGRPIECAVHLWQPTDDRGTVAVVYAALHTSDTMTCATQLLARAPEVSAVAVVTPEVCYLPTPPGEDGYRFQPELAVAERHRQDRAEQVTAERRGWFQLAALLRRDLPWWPPELRRPDAVAAWRPGAALQAIRPYAPDWYDAAVLHGLLDAAGSANANQCRGIVDRLNRRIEGEIYRPPATGVDVPGDVERPGLIQAARPDYLIPDTPAAPTLYDVLGLLNLKVPSRAARVPAQRLLCRRGEVESVVSETIRVTRDSGKLASEWIDRLMCCDDPQTLGASFAEWDLIDNDDEQPRTWWRDPENVHCWIVETVDGAYHVTVGSQLPEAGRLVEFELAADCRSAFFRDSRGTVWPMPVTAFGGYYNAGYRGTGPDELAATVARLYHSAGVDLADRSVTAVPSKLSQLIRTHAAPLSISADELGALMAEPAAEG